MPTPGWCRRRVGAYGSRRYEPATTRASHPSLPTRGWCIRFAACLPISTRGSRAIARCGATRPSSSPLHFTRARTSARCQGQHELACGYEIGQAPGAGQEHKAPGQLNEKIEKREAARAKVSIRFAWSRLRSATPICLMLGDIRLHANWRAAYGVRLCLVAPSL
jgi:hypothetical protein